MDDKTEDAKYERAVHYATKIQLCILEFFGLWSRFKVTKDSGPTTALCTFFRQRLLAVVILLSTTALAGLHFFRNIATLMNTENTSSTLYKTFPIISTVSNAGKGIIIVFLIVSKSNKLQDVQKRLVVLYQLHPTHWHSPVKWLLYSFLLSAFIFVGYCTYLSGMIVVTYKVSNFTRLSDPFPMVAGYPSTIIPFWVFILITFFGSTTIVLSQIVFISLIMYSLLITPLCRNLNHALLKFSEELDDFKGESTGVSYKYLRITFLVISVSTI